MNTPSQELLRGIFKEIFVGEFYNKLTKRDILIFG